MCDAFRILVWSGSGDNKTDIVFSTTARAPGHLLKLGSRQRTPTTGGARVSTRQHNAASGKIDTRGDSSCGKDRIEQSRAHQLFDHEFPCRNVTGVMRRHATTNDRIPMTMTTHFRVLLDKAAHEIAARLATAVIRIASRECGFRRGLIAATSGREENDGRQ